MIITNISEKEEIDSFDDLIDRVKRNKVPFSSSNVVHIMCVFSTEQDCQAQRPIACPVMHKCTKFCRRHTYMAPKIARVMLARQFWVRHSFFTSVLVDFFSTCF